MASSDLQKLLARSEALGKDLDSPKALAVNRAILAIEPDNAVATSRLGIGLLNTGRLADAVPVFEAGVEAHPDHPFMARRLDEARKALARELAAPPPTKAALARQAAAAKKAAATAAPAD